MRAEPVRAAPSADATQRELAPVGSRTNRRRVLATDAALGEVSDAPTTQLRAAGGPDGDSTADSNSELQPPRRSAAPVVVLVALGACVVGGLAWLAWPAPVEAEEPVELRRPLSVDPAHAKTERAPGGPADSASRRSRP